MSILIDRRTFLAQLALGQSASVLKQLATPPASGSMPVETIKMELRRLLPVIDQAGFFPPVLRDIHHFVWGTKPVSEAKVKTAINLFSASAASLQEAELSPLARESDFVPLEYLVDDSVDRLVSTRARLAKYPQRVFHSRIGNMVIVHADIREFGQASESLTPEQTQKMINAYHGALCAAIEAHGGLAIKSIGDGVLGAFGFEATQEQDARHAIQAALDAIKTIDSDDFKAELKRLGVPYKGVKICLNDGPCWGGETERFGNDVAGRIVNQTARMDSLVRKTGLAVGSALLISKSVHSACKEDGRGDIVDVEYLGTPDMKPGEEPLEVYRVTAARPQEEMPHARGAEQVKFIGRHDELDQVVTAIEDSFAHSETKLVVVNGEAGIGKTRFLHHVFDRLREKEISLSRFVIQGEPLDNPSPDYAMAAAIRAKAGIESTDSPERARKRVANFVQTSLGGFPEEQELYRWLLWKLLGILPEKNGVPERVRYYLNEANAFREATLDMLTRLFRRMSETQPVVVVLEDRHWIDQGTWNYIQEILARLDGNKLCVLALERPGFSPRNLKDKHPLLEKERKERGVVTATLQTLEGLQLREMVDVILEDKASPVIRERLIQLSGGNTYVLQKMSLSIKEGWTLEQNGEVWEFVEPSLVGAEMRRQRRYLADKFKFLESLVESVSEEHQRCLEAASILGSVFTLEELEALGVDNVRDLVPWLIEKKLLVDLREGRYQFPHALLRDTAERKLTDDRKRPLHRARAIYLQKVKSQDLATIAFHLETALDPRTADHAEMQKETSHYYHLAAESAFHGRGELQSATVFYRKAHDFAETAQKRLKILRGWDEACFLGDNYQALLEIHELTDRALADMGEVSLADRVGLLYRRGRALSSLRQLDQAKTVLEEALTLTQDRVEIDFQNIRCVASNVLALNYVRMNHLKKAEEMFNAAMMLAISLNNDVLVGKALIGKGHVASKRSDYSKILEFNLEAAERLEKFGSEVRRAVSSLVSVGSMLISVGVYEEAERVLKRADRLADRFGRRGRGADNLHNLGRGLYLQSQELADTGDRAEKLHEAVSYLERLLEKNPNHIFLVFHLVNLSQAYLSSHKQAKAEEVARRALKIASSEEDPAKQDREGIAMALMALAQIHETSEKIPAAYEASRQAYAFLRELGAVEDFDLEIALTHARLSKKMNQWVEAREAIAWAKKTLDERVAQLGVITFEGKSFNLQDTFRTAVRVNREIFSEWVRLRAVTSEDLSPCARTEFDKQAIYPIVDHPLARFVDRAQRNRATRERRQYDDAAGIVIDLPIHVVYEAVMTQAVTVAQNPSPADRKTRDIFVSDDLWAQGIKFEPFWVQEGKLFVKVSWELDSPGHLVFYARKVTGRPTMYSELLEDSFNSQDGALVIGLRLAEESKVIAEDGTVVEVDSSQRIKSIQFRPMKLIFVPTLDGKTIFIIEMERATWSHNSWTLIDGSNDNDGFLKMIYRYAEQQGIARLS